MSLATVAAPSCAAAVNLTRLAPRFGLYVPVFVTSAAFAAALRAPRVDGIPSDMDIGRFMAWLAETVASLPPHDASAAVTFTRIDLQAVDLRIALVPGTLCLPSLLLSLPGESTN